LKSRLRPRVPVYDVSIATVPVSCLDTLTSHCVLYGVGKSVSMTEPVHGAFGFFASGSTPALVTGYFRPSARASARLYVTRNGSSSEFLMSSRIFLNGERV
jgi:hypothetical protein